ncbi:MAG: hypothetical protein C4B58_15690 [Deltaproteobacteria bacterium]|nr:MAG: hypothetical protein C4B58_15690 [Deltaproteobacteria bacterium]
MTGADGFCYFPDIPVGTVALVTASTTDGRMSSALAVFSESKDHVAIDLQMFPPGPGKVSGTIETLGEPLEGIVSILFSKTGYRAGTIADASGAFSFNGLPLDGYFTLSIATPGDVLRSGSIFRNLTETQPTWENLDFSVKNPCPVNSTLFSGEEENKFTVFPVRIGFQIINFTRPEGGRRIVILRRPITQ